MKDEDLLTVGSLIKTYHLGYHILTRIEFSNDDVIYHYIKVLNHDGSKARCIHNCCNASFCSLVTKEDTEEDLRKTIEKANEKFLALQQFV